MINDVLEYYGIKDFNFDRDKDSLLVLLKDDNLLFKKILRLVLHRKLEFFFNRRIDGLDRIEPLIPRSSRATLVYQLEGSLAVDFPKMTLSKKRYVGILLIYVISFIGITSIYISIGNFSIFPYFFLYLALIIAVPFLILALFSVFIPKFFEPLDWDGVIVVDDLMWRLIVDNCSSFSENNYFRIIDEICHFDETK